MIIRKYQEKTLKFRIHDKVYSVVLPSSHKPSTHTFQLFLWDTSLTEYQQHLYRKK